jgi:hypothetical protein
MKVKLSEATQAWIDLGERVLTSGSSRRSFSKNEFPHFGFLTEFNVQIFPGGFRNV